MFICEAGDSILNITAFTAAAVTNTNKLCQSIWGHHSHELCITPVTHHQTMEILSVVTSVSPISQTKGLNSRPPENTPEPCR